MDDRIVTIIEKILRIPHNFYRTQTKSWNTLLHQSGYFEMSDKINEEEIMERLKIHPHLIDQWLQWSDDQRCTPTWYFTKGEDGKCFVGHHPAGKEFEEINTANEFKACAAFIKRQLES
jgi:hypothetical protein